MLAFVAPPQAGLSARVLLMHFDWREGDTLNIWPAPAVPTDELLATFERFSFDLLNVLGEPTNRIVDGEIVLELNGAVSKKLKIPPQTYILGREPGPEMFHIDVDNFPAQ